MSRPQRTAVVVRSAYGTTTVEWFLIFTIGTILVTRAYLRLTGYPQIGGGTLHIAHALWGGALMMIALIVGWLFLGATVRLAAVALGGIGFGLFLDEVGKFVTKNNDYFYGPSAEIMYILVVVVLVISRVVRDLAKPTVAEALANAASIAADGVSHGLPPRRRTQAHWFLAYAADRGGDPTQIATIRELLSTSATGPDRLVALRARAVRLIPGFARSPRWVTVFGALLVITSVCATVLGAWQLFVGHIDSGELHLYLELSRNRHAAWILFISGIATALLSIPGMIARRRTEQAWPLRLLRLAALIFTLSNALVDFALEGFGALSNLAVGLVALAVMNYHLSARMSAEIGEHGVGELGVGEPGVGEPGVGDVRV
ncbi:hypothetical protein [Gordonia polyisoprenivorans]|uniref:hypothetical protein n=1 Tax=Gordonia polyisoprenivorans TaxID=84595 RepID=UPI0030D56986